MAKQAQPEPQASLAKRFQWLIVLLLLAGVVLLCILALVQHQESEEKTSVPFRELLFPHPPSPSLLEDVRRRAGLPERLDPCDPELPRRLSQAFSQHPWVESVDRVSVLTGPRIQVDLTYRRPVAVVSGSRGRWPADRLATLLPAEADETGLIEIRGVTVPPPEQPGQTWEAGAVKAACVLAEFLMPEKERLGIIAIQLGSDPLEPDLRLITREGSQVVWTRLAPGSAQNEPAPAEKLRRLVAYAQEHGNLNRPLGPYLFDTRQRDSLLRKPIGR